MLAVTKSVSSMSLIAMRAKLKNRKLVARIALAIKPVKAGYVKAAAAYTSKRTSIAAITDSKRAAP